MLATRNAKDNEKTVFGYPSAVCFLAISETHMAEVTMHIKEAGNLGDCYRFKFKDSKAFVELISDYNIIKEIKLGENTAKVFNIESNDDKNALARCYIGINIVYEYETNPNIIDELEEFFTKYLSNGRKCKEFDEVFIINDIKEVELN